MRSSVLVTAGRIVVGVLFPIALGASGCCGCPIGWCTSLLSSSHSPPPPPISPVGMGGGGGWGIGGLGGAPAAEAPLGLEPALPGSGATRDTSKTHRLFHDKRAPIRGSLFANGSGKTKFVAHAARNAVPVGDGSAFVVAGPTGLWLHDTKDLTKRNRLVAEPIWDVAASPNGSRIAYAFSDGRLRVITYPGLTPISSVKVDVPTRMRFSSDGQRIALGSESDTVTLVNLSSTDPPKEIDTHEDVNDVFPMPDKPNQVAYASDEDEVVILDMDASNQVFSSEQLMLTWRSRKKSFIMMRDQMTVAYDSVTDTLLGGGDDNLLWRFPSLRKTPKVEDPIEMSGNVSDLACCAGRTAADRAVFVAADDGRVRAVGLDGRLGPTFGPLFDSVISRSIRISLLPSGDLLVVPNSALFRWEPRTGVTWQSNDYASPLPMSSVIDADTVFVPCDINGCLVHRVKHDSKPAADVETTSVGELPPSIVQTILTFSTGLRAIIVTRDGTLQMAYLPVGGALEELQNTKVTPGGIFAQKDSSLHGYVDPSGKVYEIVAVPRGMKQVGMAIGKGTIVGLAWDFGSSKWRVDYSEGAAVLVP